MYFRRHGKIIKIFTIALTAGTLISCGSSKKNSEAAGLVTGVDGAVVTSSDIDLIISSKLALIPPKESGSGLRLVETYEDDKTNVYVEERSLEVLNQAESILCFIAQTRFETQVNKGPYYAIVNGSLCEEEQRDDQGGKDLMNMKVLVTREPNAPLNAVGWIKEERDGETNFIHWKLVIAEGSNSQNPLGIFRFNFGFKDASGVQRGGGLIETSRDAEGIKLRFYESQDMGDRSGMSAASALMAINADGTITGGKARMKNLWEEASYGSEESEYIVDFNDSYLAKVGTNSRTWNDESNTAEEDACIDRSQYSSVVYRYGLYNADGSRKNLNSGFPIEFEKDGVIRRGNASYWGIWTEGDVGLENGASINKVDWTEGEKTTTPYTVIHAPGKLYKYTKNSIKLGDLLNTDLRMWESEGNFIVQWNGTNFVKIAKEVFSEDGPPSLEPASGTVTAPEWGYNFYVESLSAQISIGSNQTLSNNLELSFHSQELVSGSEAANLSLKCYSQCPKTDGSTTLDNTEEWNIRLNTTTPIEYTFNATNKNLYRGSSPFVAPSGGDRDWLESGVLVTAAQLGSYGSENISPWELQGKLDTYYKWQSGSNSWGQYYGVVDENGSIVEFDKPLEIKYVHSQANDFDGKAENNSYNKTFRLNYGGFGDLWGIPWKEMEGSADHKPVFSLKSGTSLQDDAGATYTVKALNVAQVLTSVDAASCAGLDPSSAPELPGEDVVQEVDIGEEPEDEIATKVIEGNLID
ncbi:MAG: hypothetical protein ACOH5I_00620 [Oligoflexus sp.]